MTGVLRLTAARAELLRAIREGDVWQSVYHFPYDYHWGSKTVSARCRKLRDAGWITPLPVEEGDRRRYFALTDAGLAALDGAS